MHFSIRNCVHIVDYYTCILCSIYHWKLKESKYTLKTNKTLKKLLPNQYESTSFVYSIVCARHTFVIISKKNSQDWSVHYCKIASIHVSINIQIKKTNPQIILFNLVTFKSHGLYEYYTIKREKACVIHYNEDNHFCRDYQKSEES